MHKKHCYLVLIFLFTISLTHAQYMTYKHHVHRFDRTNGLLQSWNWYALLDSKGELWLSSTIGLNRFNGISVTAGMPEGFLGKYQQKTNVCSNFLESENHDIWFGMENNLCQYQRKTGKFQYHSSPEKKSTDYWCHPFAIDKNNQLWILETLGAGNCPVYSIDLSTTSSLKSKNRFKFNRDIDRCVAATDPKQGYVKYIAGYKWSGAGLSLLTLNQDGTVEHDDTLFFTKENVKGSVLVLDVKFDQAGDLYVITNIGLHKIKLPSRTISNITLQEGLTNIAIDPQHRIWIADSEGGISQLSEAGQRLNNFKAFSDRSNVIISNLYSDPKGTLWIISANDGVAWINTEQTIFKNQNFEVPKGSPIGAMTTDSKENLWLTIENDLYRLSNRGVLEQTIRHNQQHPYVKILADKKDRLWLLNLNLIELYDPIQQSFQVIAKRDAPYTQFLDICALRNGKIIAPSYTGVSEIEEKSTGQFSITPLEIDSFSSIGITSVFEDSQNNLYCSKEMKEVWVLKEGFDKKYAVTSPALNIVGDVYAWEEDAHCIWIGTAYGLTCLHKTNHMIRTFGIKDGLPEQTIITLKKADNNNMWLSSFNYLTLFNTTTFQCQVFSKSDGLPKKGLNPKIAARTSNGISWFSSEKTLIATPEKIWIRNLPPPILKISKILVDDLPDSTLACKKTGCSNPDEISHISLPYSRNTLSFEVVSIDYGNASANTIYFRLDGFDTTWIKQGNPALIRFSNLPPGTYALRIMAHSDANIPSVAEKIIHIEILPPFWETWWFGLFVIGAVIGLGRMFYQIKLDRIKALQQVRQQIADDLHDDVGTSVTAIGLYSKTLARLSGNSEPNMMHSLERITENAQKIHNAFKDSIWSINPEFDQLSDLVSRMKEHLAKLREQHDLACSFKASLHNEQLGLNPKVRHNLFLIFKEAIHNSLKYGQNMPLSVEITTTSRYLQLIISDKGPGYDPETASDGSGLFTMRRRADEIKAQLTCQTALGQGVTIDIIIAI
jgi:ligand-binding sensor domain-containing protein/anti-sigma regulatory factor (Ser/Thr protein kinase)